VDRVACAEPVDHVDVGVRVAHHIIGVSIDCVHSAAVIGRRRIGPNRIRNGLNGAIESVGVAIDGIAAAAAIDGVAADVSGVKITRTFAVDGEWFRRKMEFMGGPGSGQTSARSAAKKTTVEDSLVLTASTLIRQKALRPWARTAGSWSWRSPRWISRGCAAGRPYPVWKALKRVEDQA
jgi:hypothetical protein